ncbi:MAG: tetratricopeptide repeat protein [Gammaproteobacteria bacterium]
MNDQTLNPDLLVAVSRLRKAAEAGNAAAQYRLGIMYGNGDGVPLEPSTAADWIERAAAQGHVEAQATLAWLCANGHGVRQSDAAALRWYEAAAGQGLAQAQYMMATVYRFGQFGVERDFARALDWYLKAADQGFATAQFALGRLLMDGKRVQQDDEAALQWLMLAHANGSKRAGEYIETLLQRLPPDRAAAVRERMLGGGEPPVGEH